MSPTPRKRFLTNGTLGLAEHAEGNGDHGHANKESQQRVAGSNLPNNADTRSNGGTCTSKQAGDGDGTSLDNTSLTKSRLLSSACALVAGAGFEPAFPG